MTQWMGNCIRCGTFTSVLRPLCCPTCKDTDVGTTYAYRVWVWLAKWTGFTALVEDIGRGMKQ